MTRGARIGIFGGTFNPIHLGHLRAAEEVREQLDLERVLLVPAALPPHKPAKGPDPIAPAALRLAWVRAAVADNPGLGADALEVERGGPSYTIDTVRAIAARTAPEPPVFVIGCDAFALLPTWREPEALLSLASFAVMTRPPVQAGALPAWLPDRLRGALELDPSGRVARHRQASTWVRAVEIRALDVSASDIRERIRKGLSVRYLVPESVRGEILASGVYAAPGADYARGQR
jgi:nicotinate-nucleotide adenylyltransferase